MTRQHTVSLLALTMALLPLAVLSFHTRPEGFAAEPAAGSPADNDALARQVKDLQALVAQLRSLVKELQAPRILSAGTVTIRLGPQQDNKNSVRVKLPADVVAQLGGNCIVELTNRYPTGDTFFVAYWRPATDGFDILLADPSLVGVQINPNRAAPYYVDWIVVQK